MLPVRRGHIHRSLLDRSVCVPGPGTYKEFPPAKKEFNEEVTLFESGLPHRAEMSSDNSLPPSLYNVQATWPKKEGLARTKKMMYLNSVEERFAPIKTGSSRYDKSALKRVPNLGPGQYNVKYMDAKRHENFNLKPVDDQAVPATGNFLESSSEKPVPAPTPGPGDYDAAAPLHSTRFTSRKYYTDTNNWYHQGGLSLKAWARAQLWKDKFGFGSTTKKRDKWTAEMWGMGTDTVGPGRYNNLAASESLRRDKVSGHESRFNKALPQHRALAQSRPVSDDRTFVNQLTFRVTKKADNLASPTEADN